LLIGDSISIGYTLQVRALLKGKANVHRIPGNGGATEVGLANMMKWLGDGKWDVIHFNFGLHDAKFASETTQRASREQYAENLRQLVAQMKATGAQLIFATTTPVPRDGNLSPTRRFDSIPARNEVARAVMEKNGVAINDLYSAVLAVQGEVGRTNDVHFQPAGYELLAEKVAKAIQAKLSKPNASRNTTPALLDEQFATTPYGRIPAGWRDLIDRRPSRNWAVDGNGFLRPVLKFNTGLLIYEGDPAGSGDARKLADAQLEAEFKKTGDEEVSFGLVTRVQDRNNYYLARFSGQNRLEILKVKDGLGTPLGRGGSDEVFALRTVGTVSLKRYQEGQIWRINFSQTGDQLSVTLTDEVGREVARLDAKDGEFKSGSAGLCATTFAGARSFRITPAQPVAQPAAADQVRTDPALAIRDYPVLKPLWDGNAVVTPRNKLRGDYDVVVAGAGTGGWAAAVQAARSGAKVLLLEETDWIGGQMSAAAVTTMDEDSVHMKFPVRERGLYREFHESMVLYYHTLEKDPFVTYFGWPQQREGGYEPKAARAVLYAFIKDAREHGSVLDLSLRTRVVGVKKVGDTINGATLESVDETVSHQTEVRCKVLVDATEYGDVIPLTGVRYRMGNVTSDKPDPAALVQDHTWTAVLREYPDGVPAHLQMKSPPPGYEQYAGRRYRGYSRDGALIWGGAGKGIKPRSWRVYFAWRGMVDADSPLTGVASGLRHTQCGFNGGNDYPVTAATLEDPAQRLADEREGIYRTLGALYYFQQEVGLNWSLAQDEGYNTSYNRAKMKELALRPDLEALAVHLPQLPYVRESRRIMGVRTLVAEDLTRYENAKHFSSSVAMGDYFMDLDHGKTAHAIETDLDKKQAPKGGGPFQVPFEVFIPEKMDGFLPAEKNFSQSRLANGATRLQPITMLTGQAVGVIAARAVAKGVQPRALNPIEVQAPLLNAGCTLVQRWYADVPWGSELWEATQLLSLYRILDRTGPITKDSQPLGDGYTWGATEHLSGADFFAALQRLGEIKGVKITGSDLQHERTITGQQLGAGLAKAAPAWQAAVPLAITSNTHLVTRAEFALAAAKLLRELQSSPSARL